MAHALSGHPFVKLVAQPGRPTQTAPTPSSRPPKRSNLHIHFLDEAFLHGRVTALASQANVQAAAASLKLDRAIGKIRLMVAGLGGACALAFFYLIHFLG